jgi:hypothetical protein
LQTCEVRGQRAGLAACETTGAGQQSTAIFSGSALAWLPPSTRYVVAQEQGHDFLRRAQHALAVLGTQTGYLRGRVGRAADDPTLWVLTTEWEHVGAYRRALSAYDVRVHAVPLLSSAIDEPSAYEVLVADDRAAVADVVGVADGAADGRTRRAADAGEVALGEAAEPVVVTDLD